jgi:hypothetical protein
VIIAVIMLLLLLYNNSSNRKLIYTTKSNFALCRLFVFGFFLAALGFELRASMFARQALTASATFAALLCAGECGCRSSLLTTSLEIHNY